MSNSIICRGNFLFLAITKRKYEDKGKYNYIVQKALIVLMEMLVENQETRPCQMIVQFK